MHLTIYILFGILPSLVWLSYYLRKDLHPEPKRTILKLFIYGALLTIPVFIVQVGLSELLNQVKMSGILDGWPIIADILKWFVVIAFTEEFLKYFVVRQVIIKESTLDEPLDIMLYMVVVALGFAAVENMLYLFSPIDHNYLNVNKLLETTIAISFIRFIGATFLHTLCSALIGYFLAIASLRDRKRKLLVGSGILLASLLHGLYDFSIITLARPMNFIVPLLIIMGLVIFMIYDFDEIKKVKGICKL